MSCSQASFKLFLPVHHIYGNQHHSLLHQVPSLHQFDHYFEVYLWDTQDLWSDRILSLFLLHLERFEL